MDAAKAASIEMAPVFAQQKAAPQEETAAQGAVWAAFDWKNMANNSSRETLRRTGFLSGKYRHETHSKLPERKSQQRGEGRNQQEFKRKWRVIARNMKNSLFVMKKNANLTEKWSGFCEDFY